MVCWVRGEQNTYSKYMENDIKIHYPFFFSTFLGLSLYCLQINIQIATNSTVDTVFFFLLSTVDTVRSTEKVFLMN